MKWGGGWANGPPINAGPYVVSCKVNVCFERLTTNPSYLINSYRLNEDSQRTFYLTSLPV